MAAINTCKEQLCSEEIKSSHFLCGEHWQKLQDGAISECPICCVYKDSKYPRCIECNKKTGAKTRSTHTVSPKPAAGTQKARRYDPVKADTFEQRTALLKDDQKAKDKRQLFDHQKRKCVYCGNEYKYGQLEIEHMVPEVLGGQDNIRNCQLACRICNQAKGKMTGIEFRRKNANYLPQKERTPATPPIKPDDLIRGAAPARRPQRR